MFYLASPLFLEAKVTLEPIITDINISQDLQIKLIDYTQNNITDVPTDSLSIEYLELSKEIDSKLATTTTQDFGSKATGVVTFFNKGTQNITIPIGTQVSVGANGKTLVFSTLTQIVVPAITENTGNITFGTAIGKIIAANNGPEYNLDAGILGDSNPFAISIGDGNLKVISYQSTVGGSTRISKVVTDNDRKTLLEKIKTDILKMLKEESLAKFGAEYEFLNPEPITVVYLEEYSKEAGNEAEELSLKVGITSKFLALRKSKLDTFLQNIFNKEVQKYQQVGVDYPQLEKSNFDKTFTITELTQDQLSVKLNITGKVLSSYSKSEVLKSLQDESTDMARKYLSNINGFKLKEMQVTPSWYPDFLKKMPKDVNKININFVKVEL